MNPPAIHRQIPHTLNGSLFESTKLVHSHPQMPLGTAEEPKTVQLKDFFSSDANFHKRSQTISYSPPISPETDVSRNTLVLNSSNSNSKYGKLSLNTLSSTKYKRYQPIQHDSTRRIRDRFIVEYKSQIGKALRADYDQWAQRELAQVRADNLLKSVNRQRGQPTTIIATSDVRSSANKSARERSKVICRSSDIIKTSRKLRVRQGDRRREATNETQSDKSSKNAIREDKNFGSLADYCPPLSSLLNRPNSLNVAWKGTPIDLESDEFVHLLHADELKLAGNLRLDCATYLTSKRRIFISRIAALKAGREFRKTDAQQACRIDVNKASKLWEAFDEVGWFKAEWVSDG